MSGLLIGLKSALLTMISAAFSERLCLWALMALGKVLVKKTTTPHDDVWLAKLEKTLQDTGKL